MNIPTEIEILFLSNIDSEIVFYIPLDRTVYITKEFFRNCPSKRLFQLIHELTHVQQHIKDGTLTMLTQVKTCEHEHQADTQAAQAISCPICMQIVEDDFSRDTNRASLGYLTVNDIVSYKTRKKIEDTCNAHKTNSTANQQLQTLFPNQRTTSNIFQKINDWWQSDKKAIQRASLDFEIGSMQDRLSSVKLP